MLGRIVGIWGSGVVELSEERRTEVRFKNSKAEEALQLTASALFGGLHLLYLNKRDETSAEAEPRETSKTRSDSPIFLSALISFLPHLTPQRQGPNHWKCPMCVSKTFCYYYY